MQIDVEPLLPGRDEKPTKYTSSDEKLHIKCQLRYVDLEGLSDGRSMKTILPQIAPRKLVSCKTCAIKYHSEITFFFFIRLLFMVLKMLPRIYLLLVKALIISQKKFLHLLLVKYLTYQQLQISIELN